MIDQFKFALNCSALSSGESSLSLRNNYAEIMFRLYRLQKPLYTYGLQSFSYMAPKLWNSLPDSFRTSDFPDFKRKTLQYDS